MLQLQLYHTSIIMGGTEIALTSIRILTYAALGYGVFYLTMHLSDWYYINVIDDQLEYTFGNDIKMWSFNTGQFLFLAMPIVLAAALGGLYEAVWKRREVLASKLGRGDGEGSDVEHPDILAVLHGIIHLKFRPMGQKAP